ncbi:MAG: hypothetical protein P8Y77_01355 [Nitrospirota bacterium]|jgi:hypothetical protein
MRVLSIIALLIAASLIVIGQSLANEIKSELFWSTHEDTCQQGLHHQPNGPFAILIFCEYALGDYAGVVYYENLRAPISLQYGPKWTIANRFWQEPMWASDVSSFAWSPKGTKLFIATERIYGSGGLFELNLKSKTAKQIMPEDKTVTINSPGPGYVITGVDFRTNELHFKVSSSDLEGKGISTDKTYHIAEE